MPLRWMLLLGLVGWIAGAAGAGSLQAGKLGPHLTARLAEMGPGDEVAVGVTLREAGLPGVGLGRVRRAAVHARQQGVLDRLSPTEFVLGRRYENLAGFSGRARASAIRALQAHPDVESIYLDIRLRLNLAQGKALIGATIAQASGFDGTGITVATIDSGIDTDHPDLSVGLIDERCYCSDGGNPLIGCCPNGAESGSGPGSAEDDVGHGTSVAGIISSDGVASASGVAPGAGLVAIKVFSAAGGGNDADIAAGLDWLLTNHVALSLRVVNASLGEGGQYSNAAAFPCSGTNTASAISALEQAGVLFVAASGNEGHDAGISYPACAADALSVGGVYDAAVGQVNWCNFDCSATLCSDNVTSADQFVCHANSGGLLDILAPDWITTTSKRGGGATNFGGTSAAAPYAAGMAALLFDQDPGRSPAAVRSLLMSNGPMVTNPDSGLSFRRADIASSFEVCGNGALESGEDCDDGNVVGGDCCSATCTFEGPGSACSDGDACTTADLCDGAGGCVAGSPVVCDDGAFCNGSEGCDPQSGCTAGTPPPLDDGVGCTLDWCDEATDVVVHAPQDSACDDGQFCNGDETCDVAADCQAGTPPDPNDGVACTVDGCDEIADLLTNQPDAASCDDGNACTADACDAVTGCSNSHIVGCVPAVPGSDDWGRAVLALSLALLAAIALRARSPRWHR